MSKIQTSKKSEKMETLTVQEPQAPQAESQENANVEKAPQEITVESLTDQIKVAKKELANLNDLHDFDETNADIIAKEKQIGDLLAERKTLEKANEKLKLEREFNEKLTLAKNDLIGKLNISIAELDALVEQSKDVKDTLIPSFNLVFGKKVLHVAENTTGKKLSSQTAKTNGSVNITKSVKDMLTAGNDAEVIVNFILANSDMDETKAKKRLNDIRWGWEIENGLREKPSK